jgi:hypothetical protein
MTTASQQYTAYQASEPYCYTSGLNLTADVVTGMKIWSQEE